MKLRSLLTLAAFSLSASAALAQPLPGQAIPRNDPNGTYCREYQQTVEIGGQRQNSYGTACQQPDGSWKILPSDVQQQATNDMPPIEYVGEPQYVSQPVYMVPPPVYYQPQPYYGPYPYPYAYPNYGYRSGVSIGLGFGRGGYHHGGYHHHY